MKLIVIFLIVFYSVDLHSSEKQVKKLQLFYPKNETTFKGFIIKADSNNILIWKNENDIQNYSKSEILKIENTNDSVLIAETEIIPKPIIEPESKFIFENSLQYSIGYINLLDNDKIINNAIVPIYLKSTFEFENFELVFRMYYSTELKSSNDQNSEIYHNYNVAALIGKNLVGKSIDFDFSLGINYNIFMNWYQKDRYGNLFQRHLEEFGITGELNWFYKLNNNFKFGYSILINYNSEIASMNHLIGIRYYFR